MNKDKKIIKKTEEKTVKKLKNQFREIIPSLDEMLKAGVHFGHRASKWNAKMKEYIHTTRNKVHIIDLEKQKKNLKKR